MAAVANIRLNFNLSAQEIATLCDEVIATDKKVLDEVAALPTDKLTEDSVLLRLSDHSAKQYPIENNLEFLHHVHPSEEIRNASTEADKKLSEHSVEMQMRKDVFDSLQSFHKSEIGSKLEGESKRYIERLVKSGLRSGLHLDEAVRQEIKAIKKRLSDISIDFQKNVNEENTTFLLTKEQLQGLPADFLEGRKEGDKFRISLKYPDYFPVQKKCVLPETRKLLETAFNSRCKDLNAKLLEESVQLRAKQAALLGYQHHADYILELRMAKNQKTVADFLEDLATKLKPSFSKEMEQYLKYKEEDAKEFGFENDGKVNMWDFRFYMNKLSERMYSVDHEKLKEYFPVDVVTEGLLDIYQQLLHLKFHLIKDGHTWHPEVALYEVTDADTGETMGHFYLDLYPRDGKFSHAAVFGLQCYAKFSDGTTQYPACAMVANFPKAVGDNPALFDHDDVETFFHEFGHVMHQICARSKYSIFAGTRVERDFVEAPSQMLENWVWHEEPVKRLSKHYKDGSPIPDELLQKLAASRKANAGIFNLRQVMLSAFDQNIHTKAQSDVAVDYSAVCESIMGVSATPGTCMPASFEHVIDGYDAQYYGYLWSEVYSADMFASRFGKEGVLNPDTGLSYRKCILQPGGSKDAIDMLRDFLGREPNSTAFLKEKGLLV